jgi:hypothetical protein
MLLGFKTELKLNNQQRTELLKHCGVARHAWNWGLGLTKQILDWNKANPDQKIKFPSSKTCSSCGTVKKELTLKERTFDCGCGLSLNRDLNAAINLKNYSSIAAS